MTDGNCAIEIERVARAGVRDSLALYDVVIDGVTLGRLSEGGSHAFPVAPGEHSVFLAIDWGSSKTLTLVLQPGERARLVCAPNGDDLPGATAGERASAALSNLWRATIGRREYISLWRVDEARSRHV